MYYYIVVCFLLKNELRKKYELKAILFLAQLKCKYTTIKMLPK